MQLIASVSSCNIVIWDARKGTQLCLLEGHTQNIPVLEGHPFMFNILMSAAYDGNTIVWDVDTGKQLARYISSLLQAS